MKKLRLMFAVLLMLSIPVVVFPESFGDAGNSETVGTLTSSIGFTSSYLKKGTSDVKNALVSVETADVRITMDGTTPQTTAGGGHGLLVPVGSFITVPGNGNCVRFRAINAVASSGAKLHVIYYY